MSRIAVDYLRPAMMDDVVDVTTALVELRGASLKLAQSATRDGTALVRAEVTVAAVREGRAVRLPDTLRSAIDGSGG